MVYNMKTVLANCSASISELEKTPVPLLTRQRGNLSRFSIITDRLPISFLPKLTNNS